METLYPLIKVMKILPKRTIKTTIARLESWWVNNETNVVTIIYSDSSINLDHVNKIVDTNYLTIFSNNNPKYTDQLKMLFKIYIFHKISSLQF